MTNRIQTGDLIFALDIGTRTVIGVVGSFEDGRFCVRAQRMLEHTSRAMFDGQVHDIPRVADLVGQVRAGLEEDLNTKLETVAIAAAGRSLCTVRVTVDQPVTDKVVVDEQAIRGLEYAALQEANSRLGASDSDQIYHCVGYCAVSYALDGLTLTNLVGHRGRVASIDLIATYLPDSVVDGLMSVLARVGLRPDNLTLEPIAAIDVTIPESMRLLNLALVDVGAGTSDIAITRDGSVVGYGMVPMAGDEVTEAVAQAYVVDFDTAEKLKREVLLGREISFNNVLGIPVVKTPTEVLETLAPVLDRLAAEVAESILELNGGEVPKAVFCIGGGSQVPTFTDRLAAKVGLLPEFVAVRNREVLQEVVLPDDDLIPGPDGLTVIGIATTARRQSGLVFIRVTVNGREHRVFNARDLNVAYVLSFIGYGIKRLIGRHGKDLRFVVNGREEVLLGELFRPAALLVNGEAASLRTRVFEGDHLSVVDAVDGRDAQAVAGDLSETVGVRACTINGEKWQLPLSYTINDRQAGSDDPINGGDWVVVRPRPCTVRELAAAREIDLDEALIKVNGLEAEPNLPIRGGEEVVVEARIDQGASLVLDMTDGGIRVTVNGREVVLPDDPEPVFVDVFNHVDLNPARISGTVKLRLNGQEAQYTDLLNDGDRIEIVWHERTSEEHVG